jgi:hypothetical protein
VSQERAAELMTKSGPVVCLTIAKDAASFHDLDALLNKSPLPQQQTHLNQNMMMHQSMISLSSSNVPSHVQHPNFNSTTLVATSSSSSTTLPRNHHQPFNNNNNNNNTMIMMNNNPYQQQQQQQQSPQEISLSACLINDSANTTSGNNSRTRSMSQEILKSNSEMMNGGGVSSPQMATPLKPSLRQNVVTSPTSTQHHFPSHIQRGLPNEQQIRYGSERPMSNNNQHYNNHQLNMMNGGVAMMAMAMATTATNGTSTTNGHYNGHHQQQQQQRNLPNELIPRFGSERPASSMSHMQQQQQQYHSQLNGGNQRFNNKHANGNELSPIKQQQQQQHLRTRQASLSELDEINYNNNNNRQVQFEHQQDTTTNNNNSNNQFDDLYGKVRNQQPQLPPQKQNQIEERIQINGHNHQNVNGGSGGGVITQQQYKTLPSRNGNINNISLNTQMTNGNT